MNDRDYKAQERRIRQFANFWAKALGLNQWALHFQLCREGEMQADHDNSPESAFAPLMDCETQWEYQQAHIRINAPMLATVDDAAAERCVVHELAHVLVSEMRVPDWAGATDEARHSLRDHEERVVTMLANALLWTREAGYAEGKRDARKPKKEAA